MNPVCCLCGSPAPPLQLGIAWRRRSTSTSRSARWGTAWQGSSSTTYTPDWSSTRVNHNTIVYHYTRSCRLQYTMQVVLLPAHCVRIRSYGVVDQSESRLWRREPYCVAALANRQQKGKGGKQAHVPFRDCKLTHILSAGRRCNRLNNTSG